MILSIFRDNYIHMYVFFSKSGISSSLSNSLHFTFLQKVYPFHFSNLSGIYPSLSLFLTFVRYIIKVAIFFLTLYMFLHCTLFTVSLCDQKQNLSITFVLYYPLNIPCLTHMCLYILEIKWDLPFTCAILPNMNLSGTCPSLGSNLTWVSIKKLFYI